MHRLIRPALLLLTVFAIGGLASANTYYIAANGSDTNNGTSKTSPWAHAPGMPNCASACASAVPQAGDSIIFRGGDTWHYGNSSATPYVGGNWNWTWSGSSADCSYDQTVTSTCIYIGVDQTWFAGGSWARPILSGDNTVTNAWVSSCAYEEGASNYFFVKLSSVHYVTFDNFEFTGKCWSGTSTSHGYIYLPSTSHIVIEHSYMHGWTTTKSSQDYHYNILGSGVSNQDFNQFANDILDGSDSTRAVNTSQTANCQWHVLDSNNLCASGQGIYQAAYDVHGSIFRYMSNFMVTTNTHTMHDNLFEYLYDTYASANQQHPNVDNQDAQIAGLDEYFYNNIVRHTYVTEDIYFAVTTNIYVFNNIFYDNMNVPDFGVIATGCYRFNNVSNSAQPTTAYIFNNTFGDANCKANFDHSNSPLTAWVGTSYWQNNHFLDITSVSQAYICGGTCTTKDQGNEIFQTTAAANAQGYVPANNYAPTASTNATVGSGANLTGSCNEFSPGGSFCNGTSGGSSEKPGMGGYMAVDPAIPIVPRPPSGSWDAGAYRLSAVVPPTGLVATVH